MLLPLPSFEAKASVCLRENASQIHLRFRRVLSHAKISSFRREQQVVSNLSLSDGNSRYSLNENVLENRPQGRQETIFFHVKTTHALFLTDQAQQPKQDEDARRSKWQRYQESLSFCTLGGDKPQPSLHKQTKQARWRENMPLVCDLQKNIPFRAESTLPHLTQPLSTIYEATT